MTYDTQWRATFEDTLANQEELRKKYDSLEKENRPLKTDEIENYFDLLGHGLLGIDEGKKVQITLPDQTFLNIDDLGFFLRHLAYHKTDYMDKNFFRRYTKIQYDGANVPISHIWYELKFIIFGLYPKAIAESIRMSKERDAKLESDEKEMAGFGKEKKSKSDH